MNGSKLVKDKYVLSILSEVINKAIKRYAEVMLISKEFIDTKNKALSEELNATGVTVSNIISYEKNE